VTCSRAAQVIQDGLDARAFPACVCEVGRANGPVWSEAWGRLTYDADAPRVLTSTMFDLASLTKVIATTSIVMGLVQRRVLSIDTRVVDVFAGWRGADREGVTVGHLLDHSAGLPAHLRLWEHSRGRDAYLPALLAAPMERAPGTASVYSDVGFLLLGLLLEAVDGRRLDAQWDALWASGPGEPWLGYRPGSATRLLIAPTEVKPSRGGLVQGVVHDENAEALDGVAAHAGMFSSAPAVGAFAAAILRSFHEPTWLATPELLRTFAARQSVPGSSRALGWDTMRPTSSCGTRLSPTAIGHTGFTGTSLWIDWERDLYVVLLTNRVHPTRENETFLPYRARFHDAVMDDLRGHGHRQAPQA
jgi:CubicO group peptidase (beta-lactamase class C family)